MDQIRHVLLLCLLSSCSLAISGPSANRPRREAPTCSGSKGAVAFDGLVGTGLAFAGIGSLAEEQNGTGAALLIASGALLASAIYGNSKVNRCREDFAKYAAEIQPEQNRYTRLPMPEQIDPGEAPAPATPPAPVVRLPHPATYQPARRDVPTPPTQPVARQPDPPQAPTPTQPAVTKPPPNLPTEPPPKPKPTPKRTDDEWNDFWQEVP